MTRWLIGLSSLILFLTGCSGDAPNPDDRSGAAIQTVTDDGVVVYGQKYFAALGDDTPLVMLFHQGGSNGRAEYAGLATWLNSQGYRAIAWDQRAGGQRYGAWNRTRAQLPDVPEPGYCEAFPDLQAALNYAVNEGLADEMIVWGSSYSGALVFRLGAENPARVSGVIALSPASGGPMKDCLAAQWVGQLDMPVLAMSPESEMQRDSTKTQYAALVAAGVNYEVVENGIHGSSMLLDHRTGHDMSAARTLVAAWLKSL